MAPNWSQWQPKDRTLGGAVEIAKQGLGASTAAPNGQPLVTVTAAPARGPRRPARAIGHHRPRERARRDLRDGRPGPAASRSRVRSSEERFQLLQREALELALYTFRYLPEVQQVVTKLPPPPPTEEQKRAEAKAQVAYEQAGRGRDRARRRRAARRRTSSRPRRRSRRPTSTRSTPFPTRSGARSSTARATSSSSCSRRCRPRCRARWPSPAASARPSWTRSTR